MIKSLDRQDNALARAYSDLYSRMRSSVKRRAPYPLDQRRLYSACFLGDMGALASPSIPALIRALTAQDPDLRRAAAVSLGQIGQREKAAIAALRAALKDTESSNEAAESLWRLGETNHEIFRTLAKTLNDSEPARRVYKLNVLETLGQGEPTTRAALLRALTDEDPTVRATATNALRYLDPMAFRSRSANPSGGVSGPMVAIQSFSAPSTSPPQARHP